MISTERTPQETSASEKLIVALDFPDATQALALADRLKGRCRWFKVGLELYISAGNSVINALKQRDIPNTVAGAVRSTGVLGADMLTVHASGGPAMLAAAAEAAAGLPHPPRLL